MKITRPFRLALFLAACAALLTLALLPSAEIPQVGLSDKIEHALGFALLAVLGVWTFPDRPGRVAAGLLMFGVLIEALQVVLPVGRDGEALDVVADGLGIALGVAAELLILRLTRRR